LPGKRWEGREKGRKENEGKGADETKGEKGRGKAAQPQKFSKVGAYDCHC